MIGLALRVVCLLLALAHGMAWAGGTVQLVLGEGSGEPAREFADSFADAMRESPAWRVQVSTTAPDPALRVDVMVAVGSDAFRQVLLRGGSSPVLAAMIARPGYERLAGEYGRGRRSGALFIEQPPARQVAFLRQVLPGRERVGLLGTPGNRSHVATFRPLLVSAGLDADVEEFDGDHNLLTALTALLPRVHVLLATPDPAVYKRENIRTLLVTTYRYQKPVVAFSGSLVQAGAFAAIFSTPAQLGRQAAHMLLQHGAALPAYEYPASYSVAFNPSVAAYLGLEVPDEGALRRSLAAKEGR